MGIFSFCKKKDDDAPSRRGSKSGSQTVRSGRFERRKRRAERPSDARMLDPTLLEKQRARRCLVGAIALVVAAVIVLPMILESHPKPVTDDIAIDIPNKATHAVPSHDEDPVDTQAGVAHDEPPASGAADYTQTAAQSATSSDSSDRNAAVAPPKPVQQQAAAKPAAPAPKPAAPAAEHPPARAAGASPSPPAGTRFAVQLGSFPDEATAHGWADKLKAAGVSAYVEHRKQADGSATTLLRTGPFADRTAASAAIAKVRDAGLTQ